MMARQGSERVATVADRNQVGEGSHRPLLPGAVPGVRFYVLQWGWPEVRLTSGKRMIRSRCQSIFPILLPKILGNAWHGATLL